MSKIISTGAYLPKNIVKNDFFNKPMDPEKLGEIEKFMTGMKERRHADGINETGITMGALAAKEALENSHYSAKDIDLVIGNVMPNEYLYGEDLNLVANEIGCINASVLPLNTACSTFLSALSVANALIANKQKKRVLIVNSIWWVNHAVDKSRDYSIAGDGAGAIILDDSSSSFLDIEEISNTSVFHTMTMASPIFTNKKEVFHIREMEDTDNTKELVAKPIDIVRKLLARNNIQPDWFVAHQAGVSMMKYWLEKAELPESILLHTFDHYANMTAANIPVTLNYWIKQGAISRGDTILFFAPASGAHYIAILWKY